MDVDPVEETNLDVDTVMSDGHKETTNDVAMDMTERETIDHDMATDIQVPAEADDREFFDSVHRFLQMTHLVLPCRQCGGT